METISWFTLVFLINALWQPALVVLSASLCDRLMRNAPARFRHRLWVMALVLCLSLPLSGLMGFKLPSITRLSSAEIAQADNQRAGSSPAAHGIYDSWRMNFFEIQPSPLATPATALVVAVVSCYLLSLLCHVMRFRRAWRRANEINGDGYARDIPAPVAEAAAKCRAAFGLGRISILSSSVAPSPMTLGAFFPIIILPESLFESASMETLTSALGHEMAHIRRRDFALNLTYELLRLPVAFHPAVALVKRRIDQTRESACDEMVSDHLMGAHEYARALVYLASLARDLGRPTNYYNQNLGALGADNLEERVMRLIEKKPLHSAKRAGALLIATSLGLILSGVAALAFSLSVSQDKSAKPNFSGKWKAETTTNEVGEPPFPPGFKGETIEVDHKELEFKVIDTFEADQQWVSERHYTIDDNERAMTFGSSLGGAKAEWSGKRLIITSWFEIEGRKVEEKAIWDLTDDQNTLILIREHMGNRAKTIFKKQ